MKQGDNPAARSGTVSFGVDAVRRYAAHVRRYIDRRLRNPQDLDDLAQEVYLRLLRVDDSTVRVREPLAFVYEIAARVLADHFRRNPARRFQSTGEATMHLGIASEALGDRLEESLSVRQQLERALAEVSPVHAAVLVLHNRDGLSHEEVAVELDLSVHTVRKYLTEARAQIRMKLCERGRLE